MGMEVYISFKNRNMTVKLIINPKRRASKEFAREENQRESGGVEGGNGDLAERQGVGQGRLVLWCLNVLHLELWTLVLFDISSVDIWNCRIVKSLRFIGPSIRRYYLPLPQS
jgi:hypothetical protein